MIIEQINFSSHAIQRMFERSLSKDQVVRIVHEMHIIKTYPDDQPFPSYLILGYINETPLHIVFAYDSEMKTAIVITCYIPDLTIWEPDFKKRKSE